MPQPTPPALALLDELRPLVEAIYLTEHVQRPDNRNGRSGRAYPAPINDSIVAAQHDARRTLAALRLRLRDALGLSEFEEDISRSFALPCPHCTQLTLRYRVAAEEVYCADPSCRDEQGARHTWPKAWLMQLGRMSAGDDERPLTTTERLRAQLAEERARNTRLQADNERLRMRDQALQAC